MLTGSVLRLSPLVSNTWSCIKLITFRRDSLGTYRTHICTHRHTDTRREDTHTQPVIHNGVSTQGKLLKQTTLQGSRGGYSGESPSHQVQEPLVLQSHSVYQQLVHKVVRECKLVRHPPFFNYNGEECSKGTEHSTRTEASSYVVVWGGWEPLQGPTVPPVARALGRPNSASCCTCSIRLR